jgi:hypothetical protein
MRSGSRQAQVQAAPVVHSFCPLARGHRPSAARPALDCLAVHVGIICSTKEYLKPQRFRKEDYRLIKIADMHERCDLDKVRQGCPSDRKQ